MKSVRVILVGPMYSGNIGAVARVCANFEIADLRVVDPACDPHGSEAKLYAKGAAAGVLESVRVHRTLSEAVGDCQRIVGFTRRGGGLRQPSIALGELASQAARTSEETALVFGREDGGLTTDEILCCTHVCSFVVSHTMPSLNLSHAVAVVASRLFESVSAERSADAQPAPEPETATSAELEALHEHWREAMVDAGLTEGGNPERLLVHFKKALARAHLTAQEVKMFRAYLSKTQVALGKRSRGKRIEP